MSIFINHGNHREVADYEHFMVMEKKPHKIAAAPVLFKEKQEAVAVWAHKAKLANLPHCVREEAERYARAAIQLNMMPPEDLHIYT